MGVPRDYWGMPYEMKHGFLKKLFENVNNKEISESVFKRYLDYIMIKVILEADIHDALGLSKYKHKLKKRFKWPECRVDLNNISHGIDVIIEAFITPPLDTSDLHRNSPNDNEATVCYSKLKVGDYVMLKDSYSIVKLVYFVKHKYAQKYFIAYNLPAVAFKTELKHEVLEWRQFSKACDETILFVDDVKNIHAILTIFDWNEDTYVVATCNAITHVEE